MTEQEDRSPQIGGQPAREDNAPGLSSEWRQRRAKDVRGSAEQQFVLCGLVDGETPALLRQFVADQGWRLESWRPEPREDGTMFIVLRGTIPGEAQVSSIDGLRQLLSNYPGWQLELTQTLRQPPQFLGDDYLPLGRLP